MRVAPSWLRVGLLPCLVCSAILASTGSPTLAADEPFEPKSIAPQIDAIRAVDQFGKGSAEAAIAQKALSALPMAALPAVLAAIDSERPLAANHLRSAAESIVDRGLAAGVALPKDALLAFLKKTDGDPRARRFAFELLKRADAEAADALIPTFANDPSVELRRDAVNHLIDVAKKVLSGGDKESAKTAFRTALSSARAKDQVEAIVKELDDLGEKVDLPAHFGFVMSWRLAGPFDNAEKKGFPVAYVPETELRFDAKYDGKEGKTVEWVRHKTEDKYGVVDLNKALTNHKGAVTYAAAEFDSPEAREVDIRLGTPNAWKLWVNGQFVFGREEYHRGADIDQYKVRATLKPGRNVFLLKVCQNEQTEEWAQRWQFQLRVCDRAGTAIPSRDAGQASR
jgi:hypothetical protein